MCFLVFLCLSESISVKRLCCWVQWCHASKIAFGSSPVPERIKYKPACCRSVNDSWDCFLSIAPRQVSYIVTYDGSMHIHDTPLLLEISSTRYECSGIFATVMTQTRLMRNHLRRICFLADVTQLNDRLRQRQHSNQTSRLTHIIRCQLLE